MLFIDLTHAGRHDQKGLSGIEVSIGSRERMTLLNYPGRLTVVLHPESWLNFIGLSILKIRYKVQVIAYLADDL